MTDDELARIPDDDLGRQIVIAIAFCATVQGPPYNSPICNAGWEFLKPYASGAEVALLEERWSITLEERIRRMARCDADSLGTLDIPRYEDAVEVWTELDAEGDQETIHAIKRLGEHGAKVYRNEWQRIRAGL